jgi:hypothetical protein
MNDGIGAAKVRGLACACMFVRWREFVRRAVLSTLLLRRRPAMLLLLSGLLEAVVVTLHGVGETSWMLGRQNSTFLGEGE